MLTRSQPGKGFKRLFRDANLRHGSVTTLSKYCKDEHRYAPSTTAALNGLAFSLSPRASFVKNRSPLVLYPIIVPGIIAVVSIPELGVKPPTPPLVSASELRGSFITHKQAFNSIRTSQ